MSENGIQGIRVAGRQPKSLMLNDGTRLALEEQHSGGRAEWTRVGDDAEEISVAEAIELAGDDHAGYVTTRTRAEVEWLRLVAEWYRDQADRLAVDLAGARA
jgi:hypothetical protein